MNNYDIPTITSSDNKEIKKLGPVTNTEFTMEDIINDEGVMRLSPNKRKCRFVNENDHDSVFQHYSYEGCSIDVSLRNIFLPL